MCSGIRYGNVAAVRPQFVKRTYQNWVTPIPAPQLGQGLCCPFPRDSRAQGFRKPSIPNSGSLALADPPWVCSSKYTSALLRPRTLSCDPSPLRAHYCLHDRRLLHLPRSPSSSPQASLLSQILALLWVSFFGVPHSLQWIPIPPTKSSSSDWDPSLG